MPVGTVENYQGTRISVRSAQSFDTVVRRLYDSVGDASTTGWPLAAAAVKSGDQHAFVEAIKSGVGPHDFMFFHEFNHGMWTPLFGVGRGLKCKRVLIGNPLIALTMLRYDLTAGLAVPVEILFLENADQLSTTIVYSLPSSLIARINPEPRLAKAAKILDDKLAKLVQDIASETPGDAPWGGSKQAQSSAPRRGILHRALNCLRPLFGSN